MVGARLSQRRGEAGTVVQWIESPCVVPYGIANVVQTDEAVIHHGEQNELQEMLDIAQAESTQAMQDMLSKQVRSQIIIIYSKQLRSQIRPRLNISKNCVCF